MEVISKSISILIAQPISSAKNLTQRRGGAEGFFRIDQHLLCGSAPLRETLCIIFCLLLSNFSYAADPPVIPDDISPQAKVLKPGLKLSLLVEHPDIVTPTGIDVDSDGQIWTVASHTHFRPDPYPGPEYDEVLIFDNTGKNRRVFYNQTTATMDLELGSDGWVYLAERDRILRVRDSDGDGTGDIEETIADLDTIEAYPHNGLAGLYWHPSGDLIFSLGENFWKDWTLTGTDGATISGTGEGGIFRCTANGANLRRVAKGFWNPFGVCVRDDGEIFAAENDPGSRPPCRLIHVVENGDYGYNRRYGNAPVHPFVAWDGELRGTLPMLSSSGEAPSGIVPLGGGVLAGSWSDHRLDFYPLQRQGASYSTRRITLVEGSQHFRPTCLAIGPDGAIYFTDWALTFYHLHQRGRVWKLEITDSNAASQWLTPEVGPETPDATLAAELRAGKPTIPLPDLIALCRDRQKPFLARAALQELARRDVEAAAEQCLLSTVLARQLAAPKDITLAKTALHHSDSDIVFEALRWIANEDLETFLPEVEAILNRPDIDFSLFEAALATRNTLLGQSSIGVTDRQMLMKRITDKSSSGRLRSYALRLLSPDDPKINPQLLTQLLSPRDDELSLEVCRALAARQDAATLPLVLEHLVDWAHLTDAQAAFLMLRLARDPAAHQPILEKFAQSSIHPSAAQEAQRALRGFQLTAEQTQQVPPIDDTAAWLEAIAAVPGEPDLAAGERLFHHPLLARCSSCHRHSGRGKIVGPDLSLVGQRDDRHWLLHSILQPQAEVPPQFHPRTVTMADGSTFTGFMLRSGGRSGKEFYRDITGATVGLVKADIAKREDLEISLMPSALLTGLTIEEVRDLIAYLEN